MSRRRQVQDPNKPKAKEESAATYQGWGGAVSARTQTFNASPRILILFLNDQDRKMAEAALYDGRAGPRDRGRREGRKQGFELTLDKATLLGRRKGPAGFDAHLPPPSPMRVD